MRILQLAQPRHCSLGSLSIWSFSINYPSQMAEFLGIIGKLSNFATVTEISYGVINKFIIEIQGWRKRHNSWDDMVSKFTEYLHVDLVFRTAGSF